MSSWVRQHSRQQGRPEHRVVQERRRGADVQGHQVDASAFLQTRRLGYSGAAFLVVADCFKTFPDPVFQTGRQASVLGVQTRLACAGPAWLLVTASRARKTTRGAF